MSRPYKLSVLVVSETPGQDGAIQLQQEVIVNEFSDTVEEHVAKNFATVKAVTDATYECFLKLATEGGYIGKTPPGQATK